jgi:hypothetical protein
VRSRLDDREATLAAGTSWLWTAGAMRDAVDVLFVDEAGQVSLANVIAMAGAATSIVLLGDPQQLDQPMQGSHPSGADRSALAHVLGTEATILPDRGLFLETTWRLHPVLCRFTSEVFYDDRLEPEPHLAIQAVRSRDERIDGVGPRRLDVIAKGAENVSPAEADAVAELARAIVGSRTTWVDHHGVTRPVGWDDVLIVAPYNGGHRRQVPGAAGPDQYLLVDDLHARARATWDGLPLQPSSSERGHLAGAVHRGRGRLARSAPRPGADPGADAAGQCAVPVRRAGCRSPACSRRWHSTGGAGDPDPRPRVGDAPLSSRDDHACGSDRAGRFATSG